MSRTTPEGRVLRAITTYLRGLRAEGEPVTWLKLHGHPQQEAGWPDLMICYASVFCGMEVKPPGGDAEPIQAQRIKQIRLAGGVAGVVRSVDDVRDLLVEVKKRRPSIGAGDQIGKSPARAHRDGESLLYRGALA